MYLDHHRSRVYLVSSCRFSLCSYIIFMKIMEEITYAVSIGRDMNHWQTRLTVNLWKRRGTDSLLLHQNSEVGHPPPDQAEFQLRHI